MWPTISFNKNSNDPQLQFVYNLLKKQCRYEIKKAKLACNNQLVDNALNKPKQIWKKSQDPYKGDPSLNAPGLNDFFISSVHDIINDIHKSQITQYWPY